MKKILLAAMLAATLPTSALMAQELNSTSGSASDANSASQSGAAANNANANSNVYRPDNTNAGIGSSRNDLTSTSNSGANAEANTASNAASYGNQQGQGQGQGQSANNSQGQSQSTTQGQQTTAQQGNMQGVSVSNTFNSPPQRKTTEFKTNTAVPLAASSSFSSDYCGGTVSGGASAAPLGISIGGAGPTFDKSCQSLRRAEKFGMAAANASNMGQPELAGKLMSMMIWSICTSDSLGPRADKSTAEACQKAALLGSSPSETSPPAPGAAYEAKVVAQNGGPTPEAVQKVADDARSQKVALTVLGK